LTATTYDGRKGSNSVLVKIRTHDVAITRFSLPANVRVNQTRQVYVYVANTHYKEVVHVELYKSTSAGWELFGTLTQTVPVAPYNKPARFSFSYTFTAEDLYLGKVNFKAIAFIDRDAVPINNEAISLPVKVRP
jgi:hypothetical protein